MPVFGVQLLELRRYLLSPALLWRRLGWVLRLGYLGNYWFKKGNKCL
nr:hypothetical protein [Nostoc sp. UIC 10630]